MMDAILNAAATPQGLIILVVLAFIALTLVITAVFFIVAGLLRRGKKASMKREPGAETGTAAAERPSEEDSRDPLASFVPPAKSVRAGKAPIGLARLRDAAEDFVAPARREPGLAVKELKEPVPPAATAAVRTAAPQAAQPYESAPAAATPPEPVAPPPAAPVFAYENPDAVVPIRRPGAPRPAPSAVSPLASAQMLLTLPFERRPGLTTAHAELCGMGIEAVFFDPELVARIDDDPIRLVPFLPPDMGRLLFRESDRETFRAGALCAQPDAVIELTTGLIALEFKSKGGRSEDPIRWAETMREKDLIQTVVNALVLSAESGRPVAPVLRTHNAVFFLRPCETVLKLLKANVDGAAAFLEAATDGLDRPGISALDYAGLMTVAVGKRFPKPRSAGAAYGEAAHQRMLR